MCKFDLEQEAKEIVDKVRDLIQSTLLSGKDRDKLFMKSLNLSDTAKMMKTAEPNEMENIYNEFQSKKSIVENYIETLRNSTPGGKCNTNYAEYSRFVHLHGHEYHQPLESMYVSKMPEPGLINLIPQPDWQI